MVGILEKVGACFGTSKTRGVTAGCKTMMRKSAAGLLLFLTVLFTATMSVAQGVPVTPESGSAPPRADAAPRAWSSLSADQQHLLQKYQGKWESLPADRQESLAKGSQRWLAMTPEQKSGAQQRFREWRAMPPEQQRVLRDRWQQFKGLPKEQQQRVRENFQHFRQMPAERRSELRRQWHQMSPEQRRHFVQHGMPPRR